MMSSFDFRKWSVGVKAAVILAVASVVAALLTSPFLIPLLFSSIKTNEEYRGSVYNLNKELNLKPSVSERAEYLNSHVGNIVKDKGIIESFDIYDDQIFVIFQNSNKPSSDEHEFLYQVGCYFNKSWEDKILNSKPSAAVLFSGSIYTHGLFLILDNCSIE